MCFFDLQAQSAAHLSQALHSILSDSMDEIFELAHDQAHVWLLALTVPRGDDRRLLDPEEQSRLARFVFQASRDEFLASHALTRRILAGYERVLPEALVFERNAYGRPELSGSRCGLRCSLCHVLRCRFRIRR